MTDRIKDPTAGDAAGSTPARELPGRHLPDKLGSGPRPRVFDRPARRSGDRPGREVPIGPYMRAAISDAFTEFLRRRSAQDDRGLLYSLEKRLRQAVETIPPATRENVIDALMVAAEAIERSPGWGDSDWHEDDPPH